MTKYDRLLIHWKSIKEHLKYDSATYLLLIKNFRNLGFFEDADACYYQYRKESQSRKNWFNWSKMWDHLSWISCGYGLKIWPMLVWITGAILIFAYVYNAHNGIAKDIGNTSPMNVSCGGGTMERSRLRAATGMRYAMLNPRGQKERLAAVLEVNR
jgi:hypothetical protein